MNVSGTRTVRGFLADSETGAGLGGLTVEVWQTNGHGPTRLGAGASDPAGRFHLDVPAEDLSPLDSDAVDVELRVLDDDRLITQHPIDLSDETDSRYLDLTVNREALDTEDTAADSVSAQSAEVTGRIRGAVPDGARVRAVLTTLRAGALVDDDVGQGVVNAAGWYRVRFELPARESGAGNVSLSVFVDAADGTLLGQSARVLSPNARTRIDVRLTDDVRGVSEFALIERAIEAHLDTGAEALAGADAEVVEEVSQWLDLDAEHLQTFTESRALAGQTGLPAEAFFALARNGAGPSLERLVEMPIHELRSTLEEAAADQIVDEDRLGDVDQVVERLAELSIEAALRPDAPSRSDLVEILLAADVPREAVAGFLRRHQQRPGSTGEFVESFAESDTLTEEVGDDTARTMDVALRVGELLGPDGPLLERVHALRRQGRWLAPDDLTTFTFDDWCDLLQDAEAAAGAADGAEAEDDEAVNERVEARAELIVDTLEEAFAPRYFQRTFASSEDLRPSARQLLARVQDYDLREDSIRARVEGDSELIEGLDPAETEAAIADVEAVERLGRFAQADEAEVLLSAGVRSATHAASIPRRVFADVFGEALGGREQAAKVHAQAQQTAAGSKLAAIQMVQAHQRGPFVLGPGPDIKNMPDARTLFQAAGGFCECEHCGSVYSPAAYFVDLLRYLDIASPDRLAQLEEKLKNRTTPAAVATVLNKLRQHQPLAVLLRRRPDLAELPLTCENTLTALPYIDLVNELLEGAITGGSAAFDTGKTPADVLRAVPQNLSREAYDKLQTSVHPLTLPYHQPLALARAYLGHLGVTRLDLLRQFGKGEHLRGTLVAEALGTSLEEFLFIALPPPELWRHLGFTAEQENGVSYIEALARVPVMLASTGITFQDLIDLVDTQFVNGDRQLSLDTPSPDCDPDAIRIAGLDETRLSRMVRLIRLRRRLDWKMPVLDQTLRAFGATDLDVVVLEKITTAKDLAHRLDRPLAELLVLWAPLDTWGAASPFQRLFQTRAVAWSTQDERTFLLRPDRLELAATGAALDAVSSALLAAFRITSEELARIRALLARRGTPPALDLAGLSAIYRVVVLARALQVPIVALDLFLRLVPADADPLKPGDPTATSRFADIVREVQATDFTPERLAYLFRHESDPRRDPGPLPAQVESVLSNIRRGLADAYAETGQPAEITGDVLRQKLGALVDAALLDAALEALDPRTSLPPDKRRAFFDRHLARLFPDPAAAAARLFATPPDGTPRDALEARWRENILIVLEHLLPQLRTRLLRGAVVQTLSDTLGVSIPSTARLLDVILRSRLRPNEPLLKDFQAMLGSGLTGAYFAKADLSGEPTVVRVDPDLSFTWTGAPPAEGVPGKDFGVRWTGYLLPRSKAPHTFFLTTDGAVRLTLKVADAEKVVIERPAAGKPSEYVSDPVPLDPRDLVELRLEYRNQGAPATLSLQYGTGPGAKIPIPTSSLYPAGGLTTFAPIAQSYRRLHKAAMILTGFGVTDAQLEWLTGDPPYLNLDALPMEPGKDDEALALFQRWRHLAALFALRKRLPRSNVDLFDVFRAATMSEAVDRAVLAAGWDKGTVDALIGPEGLALDPAAGLRPPPTGDEPPILRLARAVALQRRAGVTPATLVIWANALPDADMAASIVQAVKARYDEKRWLEVAQALNDPLRAERRDALVAYLLPRLRDRGITNRNQLFEYFLIDVDMNPCMLTSRVRQATATVQTFFQRALMNLEPLVPPRVIDDNDWKWLKNYRVWEANRKVFLYPENWIEPDLRDDKSPLFQALERTILQQEIKNDNVEAAFTDYLEGLDEIARLDVRGVWFEDRHGPGLVARPRPSTLRGIPPPPRSPWDHGTYHIFARTFNAPHVWYYRRLENGRTWTAWEKIEADIEGDHLVPVIFQRRMHLFWTQFREETKKLPDMDRKTEGPPPSAGKDWKIELAYSVYDRGRWSRKRMSTNGVIDFRTFVTAAPKIKGHIYTKADGSRLLSPADYTLRATVTETGDLPQLHLHLYCRSIDRAQWGDINLNPSQVDLVARFELHGCNGALVPDRHVSHGRGWVWTPPAQPQRRGRVQAAAGQVTGPSSAHPFRIANGGALNVPTGYAVNGMAYAAQPQGGALLAMRSGDDRGVAVALGATRGPQREATIVPVINASAPHQYGLYPFFFQDRFRSYFVRPIAADWRPPRLVAMPLRAPRPVAAARPAARPAAPKRSLPALPFQRGWGRREDIEAIAAENPEGRDAWEDMQDEAWHPDDAAEARKPRERERPRPPAPVRPTTPAAPARRAPAPARAPAARAVGRAFVRRTGGYHEQRLQFTPFEHTDTCAFISRLKAKGIEGLLDFTTTRPAVGRDHLLKPDGTWDLRGATWFQRYYGAGPLVYAKNLPHLDVDFEIDHPYAVYNWELFFHAPLQVAVRLAKDGRHEEAQRWFHFIFDPTTDSSSPSPRRYWRFAPFYANNDYENARDMMQLFSYKGQDEGLITRQARVRAQLAAWWEKPFSPHVIARLRIGAYQKAVVMKYIDNLVEWGDKLFRRDTMESIQEATQIYILAANILGPRPEKIPPIVTKPPLTFRQMRATLDLFSNVEIRLENLQVRRPFRISARPDSGAATAVLGMATQYFCTPANPQLDKYWDTVADRLFKIRNCMNIQGIVRQLALFDPPIDPGLLVRAAAAGVDLGSVIASLNAPPPHYRFRFLLERAMRLAEEIRSFGAITVRVLERRDAEGLAALRASNETALLGAVRDVKKKQVRQVEEALAEQTLQREHVEMQMQHLNTQLATLMNPQEEAQQKSMTAAQVISAVGEGIDLVSKVMHAIPEFQTGAAGGFSSPFVTLQLGGQMFGDIASAFSASIEKVMAKNETEADLAAAQAEYQRRREEWQHELELLAKEKAQVEKRIAEINLKLEIASAELRRHDLEVENAGKVGMYLREKYTNEQLYGWMLGQVSSVYFQAYKVAFDAAQQAERAYRFERGETSSAFIEFSYWDSLKKGLFAGERLLVDLRRLEAAHVDGNRRGLEVSRHLSLREDYPLSWLELAETGRCQIEVTESLLDGDFPGHYFRRLKTVSLSATGAVRAHRNVNCTLTLLENRIRTDANASGAYAQSGDAEDARFLVNIAPIQAVATSRPDADPGVFHLRFDDERYVPFEGAGAISTWRIELRQADNPIDLSQLTDVVLTLSYSARTGGAALEAAARTDREKGLARGALTPVPQQLISVRLDLPAVWKTLTDAPAGQEVEVPLPLDADRFSGRYRGLDVRVERATVFARARGPLGPDALRVRLDPPKGSGTPAGSWAPAWPQSRALRATAEVSGPPGTWKLAVTSSGAKLAEAIDDLVLLFDLRAKKS